MISFFSRAWRRARCAHVDAEMIRETVLGATMGWSGTATRLFDWDLRCRTCGKAFVRKSVILPGRIDRLLNPACYDAAGWPVDPGTGKKLEIAR